MGPDNLLRVYERGQEPSIGILWTFSPSTLQGA